MEIDDRYFTDAPHHDPLPIVNLERSEQNDIHIEDGSKCQHPHCYTYDFLPFNCQRCHSTYCIEHANPTDHQCTGPTRPDKKVIGCNKCGKSIQFYVTGENEERMECERALTVHQLNECKGKFVGNKTRICPADGCREILGPSNRVKCSKCDKEYCLRHRYTTTHDCVKARPNKTGSMQNWGGKSGKAISSPINSLLVLLRS